MRLRSRTSVCRGGAFGAAVVLFLAGCAPSGPPPTRVPDARPPDGLLTDTALQAVVDLQLARDGAALVEKLSSSRADVRARAAFALGSVQDPAAVPALARALSDSSSAVRRDAAFALGQSEDTAALAPLAAAYPAEKNAEVRHRILEAIGKTPNLRGPKVLLGLDVPRGEEADRALALSRLGAVKGIITEDALVWLLRHLRDPDPMVRRNAAYFIGRVRTSAPWSDRDSLVRQALASYRKNDPAAMYLLQGMGRHADPRDGVLIEEFATQATDWRLRANAMASLGPWDPREGVKTILLKGLDDPSALVAVNAAESLAKRPPTPGELDQVEAWISAHPDDLQVVAPLLTITTRTGDSDFFFKWFNATPAENTARRRVGLQALAYLGDPAALDTLKAALASPVQAVAADAAEALVTRWNAVGAGAGGVEEFVTLYSRALRLGSPRATSAVAPMLTRPQFVRRGAADTLAAAFRRMSGPEDVEPMIDVLGALTRTGDTAVAAPVLRQALTNPEGPVRQEAAADLSHITGTTVTAPPGPMAPPPADTGSATPMIPHPERIDWAYLAQLGVAPRLVLETRRGTVVVRLDTDEAPQTVQTVARLAEAGKYDGVPFHRVVPNFVVQGGDVSTHDGSGGPGFTIRSEFTELAFLRGVIGMARSSQKDTEGSQFFITHSMQPHLDGAYTSFGWVVKGMDVVDRIVQGDTLLHASIERGG